MKPILLIAFLCLIFSSQGSAQGFSGDYAPGLWTTTLSPDDPAGFPDYSENTGDVDVSLAPGEITLVGSSDPEDDVSTPDIDVDFTITAAASGLLIFDWHYVSNDVDLNAFWDQTFVLVNGVETPLSGSTASDPLDQTGDDFTIPVNAGDIIGFRVRAIGNSGGNATLTITNFVAPLGTLPVRLNFFNAKQSGEQVKLDWSTETEINSDRFEVERSNNGKDFKLIATLNAAGNSTLTQNYNAIDNNPENGNNYYRLKQIDLDGKYVYSMIKTLKWTSLQLVKVYPNPARDKVILRFTPDRNETTSITLFDGSGRTIQRRNIAAVAGSNIVTEWNVQALAPGVYFFRISNNTNSPLRFVKQ